MAIDDIYRLDYVFVQDGREWMLGAFYRVKVDDPAKTATEIAEGMVTEGGTTLFDNELDQLLTTEVDLVATIAQKIHPTFEFFVTQEWAVKSGQVAADTLPAHSTQMIKQIGEAAGRTYQGRAYLSGVPITFESDGALNSLALSEFVGHGLLFFGAHILVPITPSPLRMAHCNFSKKRANAIPPEPPVFSDIQGAVLRPSLGTQRGRTIATVDFSP